MRLLGALAAPKTRTTMTLKCPRNAHACQTYSGGTEHCGAPLLCFTTPIIFDVLERFWKALLICTYICIYKKRHSNSILSNGQDDTMISIYHTDNTWLCTLKYRKRKGEKCLITARRIWAARTPCDAAHAATVWTIEQCVVSLSFTYNFARKVRDRKKKGDWQRSEWKQNNRNHSKKKKGRKRPEEESHPNSAAARTELKPLLP